MMTEKCSWVQDGEGGPYATDCGDYFIVNEGTLAENKMAFCCYCGKPVDEVLYEDEPCLT